MTHIEVKYVEKWPRYQLKCVHIIESIYYYCISSISQPFIKVFCFNTGHFEALCILEHPYSNIFEYSNDKVDDLLLLYKFHNSAIY